MTGCDLTVHEIVLGIQRNEVSAVEVMQAYLDRTNEVEAEIQAWEWIDPERAIAAAEALDHQPRAIKQSLAMAGVPIGIKDIMMTQGIPTTMGSPIYGHYVPDYSATVVHKIEQAGGLCFGKTVTTEFAFRQPGKTRNPWNLGHTPGGSSSGSAAAVAARSVPAALGTQTLGSVIRPAAFCGIVGYKPSYGLISRYGVHPLSHSLDHVGVFTRTVVDAALVVANLMGVDSRDQNSYAGEIHFGLSTDTKQVDQWQTHPLVADLSPRIAVVKTSAWPLAEPYQQQHLQDCATALENAGAGVDEIELPALFDRFHDVIRSIMLSEIAQHYRHLREKHPGQLSDRFEAAIQDGSTIAAINYLDALETRNYYQDHLQQLFSTYDTILTIPTPGEAPAGLDSTGNPIFCELWTLCRLPAITIPTATGPTGLPIGLQVVGPYLRDRQTLQIAQWCERHL